MNIIIKSADFKVGKGLETFIREKVKKLFTQSNNIICANVILRKEAAKNRKNKLCEIRLEVPGYDHFEKIAAKELVNRFHNLWKFCRKF